MVKHTQTIRRQIADKLFECVWPFCGIGAWRVNIVLKYYKQGQYLFDATFIDWKARIEYNSHEEISSSCK